MTLPQAFYPVDLVSYERIVEDIKNTSDIDRRLPYWPFRIVTGNIDICQFSMAIERDFGPVLQLLADTHHDESVSVSAFEPTAGYYRDNYGSYSAFTLPTKTLGHDYWGAVSHEPSGDPTGALAYTANVVGMAGSTGAWAVWAERSWDLAIIASKFKDGPWRSTGVEFVRPETALADFTEPDFKLPLPPADREMFLRNFRARGETI